MVLTCLLTSTLCDIANPRQCLITALLNNLHVSNLSREKYTIFRYLIENSGSETQNAHALSHTCMPDTVKYGISNLTVIGGFPSASAFSTLGRPKWARIRNSLPPCTWRHIHVTVQCTVLYKHVSCYYYYIFTFTSRQCFLQLLCINGLLRMLKDIVLHSVWNHFKIIWHSYGVAHREGFDAPHHEVLLRNVFGVARAGFEFGRICITWHRNTNLNIICYRLFFKLAFSLKQRVPHSKDQSTQTELKPTMTVFFQTFTMISTRLCENFSMTDSIQMSGFTCTQTHNWCHLFSLK